MLKSSTPTRHILKCTWVHLLAALLIGCTSPSTTPGAVDADLSDVRQSTDAPGSDDALQTADSTPPTDTAPAPDSSTPTDTTLAADTVDEAITDAPVIDSAVADGDVADDAPSDAAAPTPARFLALGDSYTIGESVEVSARWPVQLVATLREGGLVVEDARIIARTGWTTGDLDQAIDREMPEGPYALVSLLIGVNDQFRGGSAEAYRPAFEGLLDRAVALAGGDPSRVFVVSIPDWGVTPFATRTGRDSARIAAEIDAFNAVNREEAEAAGVAWFDITPISREAADDPTLLAPDGLHPSGEMYRRWVARIAPTAASILER